MRRYVNLNSAHRKASAQQHSASVGALCERERALRSPPIRFAAAGRSYRSIARLTPSITQQRTQTQAALLEAAVDLSFLAL